MGAGQTSIPSPSLLPSPLPLTFLLPLSLSLQLSLHELYHATTVIVVVPCATAALLSPLGRGQAETVLAGRGQGIA